MPVPKLSVLKRVDKLLEQGEERETGEQARQNDCQISQNYILHMKFSEFFLCFHNSCEIWHSFSQTSMRNSLWCYYGWLIITSLALEKCKKECNIL